MNIENVDSQIALQTVLQIGSELNMCLSDYLNVERFVEAIMDRIEGRKRFVNEMQYLLQYKQFFLVH